MRLHLEDVLVADVTFNVLSPEDPPLSDGGLECSGGKRNLKLEGVNRAWWALNASSGGKDMEIDSVACERSVAASRNSQEVA